MSYQVPIELVEPIVRDYLLKADEFPDALSLRAGYTRASFNVVS